MAAIVAILPLGAAAELRVGAARADVWRPMLEGKRVALLSNHTGMIDPETHTLDFLLDNGVEVTTLFSPEHGFRGTADAGEHVGSSTDPKTGLPIASMYDGKNRAPAQHVMDRFDVLVVDIQDVGARFYTYHITMLDLMAACAASGKEVIVMDRPNPLGMITDGPVLDMNHTSGVGRIPVPLIHGMTLGEIARMACSEGWIKGNAVPKLTVVPVEGYTHSMRYELPVAPSPNLRDMQAIYLYPSLCLFEGTPVSVGRGTERPFTLYGYPGMANADTVFTPRAGKGARNPLLEGRRCNGRSLTAISPDSIIAAGFNPAYVIEAYRDCNLPADKFFKPFFTKLAGTPALRLMIEQGLDAETIRSSWKDDVEAFKARRKPYLLYPD